jgi:hypothetical protein
VTDIEEQEALMVRYLLGQSPEEERAKVEERYFSDREYFDQLLALEDSLIDDFVTDRMPAERRSAFKESMSNRDDEIQFSQALYHAVAKKKPHHRMSEQNRSLAAINQRVLAPKRPLLWILSFAAIILLALTLGLLFSTITLHTKLSKAEAEFEALRREKEAAEQELNHARSQSEFSEKELETERSKRIEADNLVRKQGRPESSNQPKDYVRIVLASALRFRSATSEIPEARLSDNIRWVQFVIPLKASGDYESYRIRIKAGGDEVVFESGSLKPTARRGLVFTVRAAGLPENDYRLTLIGERPGSPLVELRLYAFRITR